MKPQSSRRKASRNVATTTVLTPAMIKHAEIVAADKKSAVAMLQRAGILNKKGKLAKQYAS